MALTLYFIPDFDLFSQGGFRLDCAKGGVGCRASVDGDLAKVEEV